MTTDTLSNDELVALYIAVTAGFNPKPAMGYEKAESLFTEQDGTKMHSDTRAVFNMIVGERTKQS